MKKPHPAVYHWVIERLRIAPADALAIEDSRDGLISASRGYRAADKFAEALVRLIDLGHYPKQYLRPAPPPMTCATGIRARFRFDNARQYDRFQSRGCASSYAI